MIRWNKFSTFRLSFLVYDYSLQYTITLHVQWCRVYNCAVSFEIIEINRMYSLERMAVESLLQWEFQVLLWCGIEDNAQKAERRIKWYAN